MVARGVDVCTQVGLFTRGLVSADGGPPVGIGAGILNIYRAIGGATEASIGAPETASPGATVAITAEVNAVVPPGRPEPAYFKYRWTIGGKAAGEGRRIETQVPQSGSLEIVLEVEDISMDGSSKRRRRS
jgi:hypothetical protein